MNCDEVRDRLEGFVAGDAGDEAAAITAHLAGCPACAGEERALRELAGDLRRAGDAFRPRLLPPEVTLLRAAREARHRRVALAAAAACLTAALAAVVVALAIPATARHTPLPVGQTLRQLDGRTKALDAALVAATRQAAQAKAELAARKRASRFAMMPAGRKNAGHEAGILKSIAAFFGARAAASMPAQQGAQAQARLAQVTVPGSQAARTTKYFALGMQRTASPALRLSDRGAVALVTGLQVLTDTRAVAFVRPFSYASWVQSGSGQTPDAQPRQAYWSESDHRVVLVKAATGEWLVAEDVSSDPLVARALKAGGAPQALIDTALESSASKVSAAALVPDDAVQTITDVLDLIDHGQYAQTADLFADGQGIAASSVDPYWRSDHSPGLQLKDVQLMIYSAKARPGPQDDLYVQVSVDSAADEAHPLFVAGGSGVPAFWELKRAADGRWLVVSMNTGP